MTPSNSYSLSDSPPDLFCEDTDSLEDWDSPLDTLAQVTTDAWGNHLYDKWTYDSDQ